MTRRSTAAAWAAAASMARLAEDSPFDLAALLRHPAVAALIESGIRFEACVRQLVRRADTAIHYHEGGSGRDVVLINGWTASGLVWPAGVVGALERDHRVVRIDNRGTGWSRHAPRPYTIADLAGDVRRVIDRLRLQRPTVVGLSMGGMVAQELAIRWPDRVGRLVLIGSRPPSPAASSPPPYLYAQLLSTPEPGVSLREFLRDGWATVAGPRLDAERPGAVDEMAEAIARRPTPRFAVLDQARAMMAWGCAQRLRRIAVPTTVVHGTEDPLVPVHNGMRLAQLIPGARYVELPGVGHLVPYEAPDVVASVVADGF